jgi:hypothetical protein
MQVESNDFTLDTVNRLIFLYSQAIEYYEGVDQARYQNYYKKIQNLVSKPSVHEAMKNKTTKKKRVAEEIEDPNQIEEESKVDSKNEKFSKTVSFLPPRSYNKQKLQMDILLMQEDIEDQNKNMLQSYDKESLEKSKLLESDIRSQSFSLEKRLARRRFTKSKSVLTRSHSSSQKTASSYFIGNSEDSTREEYSSIYQKYDSKLEDSWNLESKVLLSNLSQGVVVGLSG